MKNKNQLADKKFWDDIRKSASLVKGMPTWTQAGLVLSENFIGGLSDLQFSYSSNKGGKRR
jgi:hypothetical protein